MSQVLPTERTVFESFSNRYEEGFFGAAVAIGGDRFAVGAPGQVMTTVGGPVFVFDRREDRWRLDGLFDPCRDVFGEVSTVDRLRDRDEGFGCAIDMDGDTLVAGSPYRSRGLRGEVLVYERHDIAWSLVQVLDPPEDSIAAEFGLAVLLSHDLLLVVARADPRAPGPPDQGRVVHGYRRDGACWIPAGELLVGSPRGELGPAIAVSGDQPR